MKTVFSIFLFLIFFASLSAQDTFKIPLDHSVYDYWKRLEKPMISTDGKWISYEINSQKGDGKLILYNTGKNKYDTISRGYENIFSYNSEFAIFKIKAPFDTVRQLKLKKTKKENLPKDTLGIYAFAKDTLIKFYNVSSVSVPQKGGSFLGFLNEMKENKDKKDTTKTVKDTTNISKDTTKLYELTFFNPVTSKKLFYKNVTEFSFSKNGDAVVFVSMIKGKTDTSIVNVYDFRKDFLAVAFKYKGYIKKPALDTKGNQLAFLHSTDTSSIKRYRLYGSSEKTDAKLLVDSTTAGMFQNYEISLNDSLFFSEDGKRLYFFTAPKILSAPKDTLLDEEKYKLDLWNWQDGQLITQQLHDLDKEKRRTYLAVYNLDLNTFVQIADSNITEINLIQKGNYNYALGSSYKPYEKLVSWEDARYRDYYLINLNTGEKQIIQEKKKFGTSLTSSGNFLVWYEPADSSWKSYNITDTKTIILTENIPVKFYDEEFDIPNDPTPYGIAGLGRNDDFVLIYDKYDIWKFSPAGKFEPLNLTKTGRDTKTIFRYVKTETDSVTVEDKILLKAFNEETYLEGFFELDLNSGKLTEKIMNDYGYTFIEKSKKSGKIIWQKYSYTEYPDLWVSDVNFSSPVKISNTNPQQEKYIWGKVEVFNWSFDGKKMKGLIYKPENYDSTIKYPAIVYYYEKHTDRIHNHYIPNPSRSVVNFPLYNSNGYIIFSPDITYEIGYPGKSALNTVISGTNALIDKGIIDKDRVGLQGQSWGGYQTAYIVTQTNMFRAAMAGAPVVNMTSAYGGIRWESGLVREFQYEQAQSRIGKTLWDGFDLYIENSPLFFADKIETPLLLMANDNDGAVPWQQGIEFFTALRRLNKPSWMLTYNGDEHNLTKWPNRVDLSIRMKQFFDYYLKGEPMPLWMSDGIRAIDKGIKSGYELK